MGNKHMKQHKQNVQVLAESIESVEMGYDESPITVMKDPNAPKKILLLSTKSSGKSTIFRQIQKKQNVQATKEENAFMIQSQCKAMAVILCKMVSDYDSVDKLNNLSILKKADLPKIAKIICKIWNKPQVQQKYATYHVDKLYGDQIMDNTDYFLQKVDEIMTNKYKPSEEDVLKCKFIDANLQKFEWTENRKNLSLIDVPSSYLEDISEHKSLLSEASAVIFLVDLSDYAVYNNDVNENALKYAMECFESLMWSINWEWFKENSRAITLWFNKCDIFCQMIKSGIQISECFGIDDGWDEERDYGSIKPMLCVPYFLRQSMNMRAMSMEMEIVCLVQKYVGVTDREQSEFEECYRDALKFIKDKFVDLQPWLGIKAQHLNAIDDVDSKLCAHKTLRGLLRSL